MKNNSKDDQQNSNVDNSKNDTTDSLIPSVDDVADFLLYGLSIPERAVRSSTAAVSGALRQSTSLLIPQAFRSSKSYTMFVEQMLDFMAHDVGNVEREKSNDESNDDSKPEEPM